MFDVHWMGSLKKRLALFGAILPITVICLGQTFPSYQEVQQRFLREYNTALVNNSARFVFEKKPEGWFVRKVEFFPRPYTRQYQLWWSAENDNYSDLLFDRHSTASNSSSKDSPILPSDPENLYDLFPYYGYKGWERDVLRSDRTTSPVKLAFQKAMCYASLANVYLENDIYPYDTSSRTEISTDKLGVKWRYNNWIDSSIYFLKKVKEFQFDFTYDQISITNHIRLQFIKRALFLGIYFDDSVAIHSLAQDLYGKNELSYYQNILISCPTNALLFVSGDLDALPLSYLTQYQGYRKDVVVIHRDWLADARYLSYLQSQYLDSNLFGVHSSEFMKKEIDFVRVLKYDRIRQKQLPGEDMATQKFRGYGMPDNSYQIEDFDLAQEFTQLEYLLQFVAQDFDNQMDNGLTRYLYFPTDGVNLITDSSYIRWRINVNLLNRGDLVYLDLISNNVKNRPVCIASSTPSTHLMGMNGLRLRGLVYELADSRKEDASLVDGISLHTTLLYQNLLFDFKWMGAEELTVFQYYTYWNLHFLLIKDLAQREKFHGVLSVLDHFFMVFDPDSWLDAQTIIEFVEFYFMLNDTEKGLTVLKQLRTQLNSNEFSEMEPGSNSELLRLINELVESNE